MAAADEMFTMLPGVAAACQWRMASRAMRRVPVRLVSITFCRASSVTAAKGPRGPVMAALLTRAVTGPRVCSA